MPYLIDGNNLMGTMKGMRMDDPEARRRLLRFLLGIPLLRTQGIALVFDGPPEAAPVGPEGSGRMLERASVRFSGAGITADDAIVGILARASPEHYLLVTSDRELQMRAQALGVRVQDCREFLREIEHGQP